MEYRGSFCGSCNNLRRDFRCSIRHILFYALNNLSKIPVTKSPTIFCFAGAIVIIIFLILKYLGACDTDQSTNLVETATWQASETSETEPIMPAKSVRLTYGTNEEDDEGSSCSSSEDLYDAKLCVICYDDQRNCFFVPCGHCATCYDCAQR
jgi:hypothetical protein